MEFKNTDIYGFEIAMKGMRNPYDSWHLNDTVNESIMKMNEINGYNYEQAFIGENDMGLAKKLIKAGPEHCKFLRQIQVWVDVDMPRYWWSEADTYKFGTKNSCSTMHKLFTTKEITYDDFVEINEMDKELFDLILKKLNELRVEYLETKDFDLVRRGKKLLPESFLQMRTWNTNYAEIRNMYFQRKNHRLREEWVDTFCKWVENLPYAYDLILYK